MSIYSISQVETLTGIQSHTLRIWEKRYDFLKPNRTDTNIRYYSDEQLRKLLNISKLTKSGYRISKINKMTDQEINKIISELSDHSGSKIEDEINSLTISMLDLNEQIFDKVYNGHVFRHGFSNTFSNLIIPFLNHVGVLWGTNRAMPAQEHFISNLIKQKLYYAISSIQPPATSSRRIVLFLPEGEFHELGLLYGNFLAKELGWTTYYLGPNVPLENLNKIIEMVNPDMLFTMFVTPRPEGIDRYIKTLKTSSRTKLAISGSSSYFEELQLPDNVHYLPQPSGLASFLQQNLL